MKKTLVISVITILALAPFFYAATQEPKVWCDKQWCGVAFLKGGYRSYSMSFCDGFQPVSGKMKPIVIENGAIRYGYYRFPRFRHALGGATFSRGDGTWVKKETK